MIRGSVTPPTATALHSVPRRRRCSCCRVLLAPAALTDGVCMSCQVAVPFALAVGGGERA